VSLQVENQHVCSCAKGVRTNVFYLSRSHLGSWPRSDLIASSSRLLAGGAAAEGLSARQPGAPSTRGFAATKKSHLHLPRVRTAEVDLNRNLVIGSDLVDAANVHIQQVSRSMPACRSTRVADSISLTRPGTGAMIAASAHGSVPVKKTVSKSRQAAGPGCHRSQIETFERRSEDVSATILGLNSRPGAGQRTAR
jgi:hypothetical protein